MKPKDLSLFSYWFVWETEQVGRENVKNMHITDNWRARGEQMIIGNSWERNIEMWVKCTQKIHLLFTSKKSSVGFLDNLDSATNGWIEGWKLACK